MEEKETKSENQKDEVPAVVHTYTLSHTHTHTGLTRSHVGRISRVQTALDHLRLVSGLSTWVKYLENAESM